MDIEVTPVAGTPFITVDTDNIIAKEPLVEDAGIYSVKVKLTLGTSPN